MAEEAHPCVRLCLLHRDRFPAGRLTALLRHFCGVRDREQCADTCRKLRYLPAISFIRVCIYGMERTQNITPSRWPAWFNAIGLLIASFFAIAALSLQVRPGAEVVAVAFPPWWSTQEIFAAAVSANAAIVRLTAIPSILVVQPDSHDGLTRLREAGVWLTIDPQASAACLTK